MHLSKTTSELRNDPLYDEAFFPSPSDELREISKSSFITPGADGFMKLAKHTYEVICARSQNYRRTVPESAHTYYLGITLIYRFLKLHSGNQNSLTYDEASFIDQFEKGDYKVPASFEKYLAGFGNTQLPSGVKQWFKMNKPTLLASDLGVPGFFGKISEKPGKYASYLSSGVLISRIQNDLRYTSDRGRVRTDSWDLPAPFAYQNRALNKNCLGYAPSVALSTEQTQFIVNREIEQNNVRSSNASIAFCVPLMNAVSAYLNEVRGLKLFDVPKSLMGSQGQLITVLVEDALRQQYRAYASHRIVGSLAKLGSTFMYKVKKVDVEGINLLDMVPNDFPADNPPEAEYLASVMECSVGWDAKLEVYDYESTSFNTDIRLKSVVQADMGE